MKFLILFFAAVATALPIDERAINDDKCGTVKVPMGRIVGGETAEKGQYPWIASLQFKRLGQKFHTCGCSIIDDQWILAAAHCFLNSKNPTSYIVRIGTYNNSAGTGEPEATELTVSKLIPHEKFSMAFKIQNDIALIKLTDKINFDNNYVNRICLPKTKTDAPTDGKVLTLAGWGDTVNGDGKALPQLLKHTTLEGKTDAYCKQQWGSFMWGGEQMVCAEAPATSPCVGDSGGPLALTDDADGHYTQIGVVSFGEKSCAGPRPGVFTRVAYFIDWIQVTIAANP